MQAATPKRRGRAEANGDSLLEQLPTNSNVTVSWFIHSPCGLGAQGRPVARADGLKSERKVCVLRIDFFRARKWPTITASNISNASTAWDTQNNTQYHTPDANMTFLIIRHDRTDERGCETSALAQRTAAARASRDQHMHTLCPCALEACSSP